MNHDPTAETDAESNEPLEQIAIVGLSGRFPGAGSVDEFWRNVSAGVEARTEFSDADLAGKVAPKLLQDPNYVKAGFILDGVDGFDADFFNFTDRQAQITDPQQRLFLECAWEALESAGIDVTRTESLIGVYAGASQSTYAQERQGASLIHSLQTLIANDKDYLATQTAYRLNLRGPCITVQTACSTGLVAVHLGCQSLLNHECDVVLAGAVTVRLPQCGYLYEEGAIWSPDGHCRVFDKEAKGTVFGNGVGVVVLKRLSEALADGDPIWAVIKGSAVNNDGARKFNFTTSSQVGQMEVISEAWAVAGVAPESISYVETHGTGTTVGDPIEVQTLASLFEGGSPRCAIGSVKSNVGHLETAAGIAGLIKTVLALHHRQIPPSLNFSTPNPEIDFERIPLYVNTKLIEWPAGQGPRRAGVSSFGIGGTNAHVVLEEAPARPASGKRPPAYLLTLSGRNERALRASAEAYRALVATDLDPADLCHTTHVGRCHHSHRLAVAANSAAELQSGLAAYLDGEAKGAVAHGIVSQRQAVPKLAFLFTGQGSQYAGMGRELYSCSPSFRRDLDRCGEILRGHLDRPLLDLLSDAALLDQTTYTQPALFALEYALARLWLSWGVRPDVLLGHSVGELAAACVAGVFSLEDGLALIAARARLMGALPRTGDMVALRTDEERLRAAMDAYGGAGEVAVATVNGPNNVVLSGRREAVQAIVASLAAEGIQAQRLNVSHAFHSPLMEPMLEAFGQVAAGIAYHPPRWPLVSNLTGSLAGAGIATPGYWVRHVREAVRFSDGLATLREQGIGLCLEIGPKPVLLGLLGQQTTEAPLALPSLRDNRGDWRQLMESLAQLYVHGATIDWDEVDGDHRRRKLVLPTYPFQRRRYWLEGADSPAADSQQDASLAYTVAWEPGPDPASAEAPPGRWLLLADRDGVGEALAGLLAERHDTVDVVTTDAELEAWAERRRTEGGKGMPWRGAVHLWGTDDTDAGGVDGLMARQQRNLGAALRLVRLVAAETGAAPRLWIATRGAQRADASDPVAPGQTPLWGLGRVIALEHGESWGGLIDLEPTTGPAEAARQILRELMPAETDGETQVAYRKGRRLVARLARHPSPAPSPAANAIRHDALYLITGGQGALGVMLAEWLAAQGARHLILTGRSRTTDAARLAALAALEAKGVEVRIVEADAADEAAMRALFARIAEGHLPLKGVFHAAGVLDDGILLNQDWDRFRAVLSAKVAGGWVLHELTRDLDLDFLVLFSSLAALVGNPGQGNYAAANAFLDGLAHYRRRHGLPALSIDWGPWANAGMAARMGLAANRALAPEAGLDALARLLAEPGGGPGQVAVAPIDWGEISAIGTGPQPFLSRLVEVQSAPKWARLIQELTALPPERRPAHLRNHLQGLVERLVGGDTLPDPGAGFTDLGIDSLLALEMRRQLQQELDHSLLTTLIFEYPTIDALTDYLLDEVLGLTEPRHPDLTAPSRPTRDAGQDPIAVIGMACRMPGADTPEAFWTLLRDGVDMTREVPSTRWNIDDYYDPQRPVPGKMYTRRGTFVDGVDQFDPLFFGIAPREAIGMDPQHRLLLEMSWEALERAGLAPGRLVNSRTGVFVGIGIGDYDKLNHSVDPADLDTYSVTNSGHSVAAGRLAYTLGLQGPTLAVDTACSSSLVAIHLACQSLRAGECDLALAGSIQLMITPLGHVALSQMQVLAPDGRCKTFDASADGYGRGEGGGVLVLKRLGQARADGDNVLAVIRGSAVNHGGPSSGLTVPNRHAQEKLLREALGNAGLTPDDVAYVEAHGTGTPLGDPIELRALGTVFNTGRQTPLLVGSVKTNVGHLETAAGMAGFLKVMLALQHDRIPAHLHFATPTPHIEWQQSPIEVPTRLRPWPGESRVAGISSFGISGTNAHILVAPPPPDEADGQADTCGVHLLPLSAKTPKALSELAARYLARIEAEPGIDLGALCHTTAVGRNHFQHRLAVVMEDQADLRTKLAAATRGEALPGLAHGSSDAETAPIAFLFTGQGSQYAGMGRELYSSSPSFRRDLDRCGEILRGHLDRPLLDLLSDAALLDQTTYTQPALFALEYALARLWLSWGVRPDVLLGHSVGELAAACVAGVFSLEDGLALIAARARLMGALPRTGDMVALRTDEERLRAAMDAYGGAGEVAVATVNGPNSVVLSGRREAVQAIVASLAAEGIQAQRLNVSHAFHSPLMEPMLEAFGQVAAGIAYHPPRWPLVSNLTGSLAGAEIATPGYWVRHVREAVRFSDGLATLREQGIGLCLEIGPKPVLLGLLGQQTTEAPLALPSLRDNRGDWRQLMESLAQLYVHGATIDWDEVDGDHRRRKLVLPTYPFQRRRYLAGTPSRPRGTQALRPLIDRQIPLPHLKQTVFEKAFSTETLPFLADHHVYGEVVVPGACHLSLALSGADLMFAGGPCLLEDVIFMRALVLPESAPRTVQLVADTNGGAFQILSFAAADEEPVQHVTGRLARLHESVPSVRPDEIQARCPHAVMPQTIYGRIAAGLVDLGPTFRWFDSLWQGEPGEALARFRAPEALTDLRGYPLFPSLIDAAFQLVAAATMGDEATSASEGTQLPFALETLAFHGPAQPAELWGHARRQDAENWHITLFGADGAVIAELKGFRLRAVPTSAIRGNRLHTDWLHAIEWAPVAAEPPPSPPEAPDAWLLAGRGDGLEQTLFPEPPAALLRVSDPTTLRAVLAEAATRYHSLGVVYLGHSDAPNAPAAAHALGIGLLDLAQALLDTPLAIRLWIVTQGAQVLPGDQPPGDDRAAAGGVLWGFGRTLAVEQPDWRPVCIDLDPTRPLADQAEALRRELLEAPVAAQWAWRHGTRYRAEFKPWSTPPLDSARSMPLRPDAGYLITGGLGGLGLQIARQLVEDGARHLVLSGRSGAVEESHRQALDELAQAGATVRVVPADIGDRDSVQALLGHCAEFVPLGGIVHAAGVLDDGVLREQNPERFARVMRPKADGCWHLHSLTQGHDLDFFVCFSSAASLLGSAGQSNYAAANAFMDSLMQQRRLAGLAGTSIGWGAWSEVGMAAQLHSRRAMHIPMVPPAQGRLLFRHLLLNPPSETIGVLPRQDQHAPSERSGPSSVGRPQAAAFDRQSFLAMAPGERVGQVAEVLRDQVAAIGGFTTDQLDNRQSLIALGVDSLMVIELRNRANSVFDVLIPVSVFLDNGSIEALAPYIVEQLEAGAPTQSAQPSVQKAAPAPETPAEGDMPYDTVEGEL